MARGLRIARGWVLTIALGLGGCGLLLDPRDPRPDAARTELDARVDLDAAVIDARSGPDVREGMPDAPEMIPDAPVLVLDAARPDALAPLDASFDARPAPIDAAMDAAVPRDAPDADARDAPDGDARDAPDADARDGARTADAFCTDFGECRLLSPLCGCVSSETCQYDPVTFTPTCVPPGTGAMGSACDSELDCARGLTCMYLGVPPGVCRPFCDGSHPCTEASSVCVDFTVGGVTLPAGACSPICDPIGRTGCPPGLVCDVGTDPVATYCRASDPTGGPGTGCTMATDCAPGTTCAASTCRTLCRVGTVCASGELCVRFAMPLVVRGMELGTCP